MKVPVNHVAIQCGRCRYSPVVGFLELRDRTLVYSPKVTREPEPVIPWDDLPAGATFKQIRKRVPEVNDYFERFGRSWSRLDGRQLMNANAADKPVGHRPVYDRFEATCPACGYVHRRTFRKLLSPVTRAIRAGRTTFRLT